MRKLKLNKFEGKFSIEHFENKAIARIALKFAETENELDELYNFGTMKFVEYKNNLSESDFISFSTWNIQQDIIKKKKEISTT